MLAAPIKNADGGVAGVLVARLDGFVLSEITDTVKYGEHGYSYIIDGKGALIAHANRDYVVESRNFLEEGKTNDQFRLLSNMMQRMTQGEKGFDEYLFLGANRVFGYAPISGTGWSMAVGAMKTEVFGGIYAMRHQFMLFMAAFLLIGGIAAYLVSRGISRPIVRVASALKQMATGDLNVRVNIKSKDEIGEMAASFAQMVSAQQVKADALTAVSMGDLSRNITLSSNADTVGQALQNMVQALKDVMQRNEKTCQAQKAGDMDARTDLNGLNGDYKTLAAGVNEALESISRPTAEGIAILNEYAEGNLNREMRELPGKQMLLTRGLRNVRNNLQALITDVKRLVDAGVNGNLAVRADASKHQGAYAQVIQGVNTITETLSGQISVTMRYLEDIAHGKQLEKYTGQALGDYQKIKDSINICVEVLTRLQNDALAMAEAGAEGRLEQQVNGDAYEGSWWKIAAGLNGMMEAVRVPLEEVGKVLQAAADGALTMSVTGEYKGAFDLLKTNLNTTISSLNNALVLVSDAVMQVNSGAEQISDASQSLSQGATEQASSLEEITSSVTEIASQTKTNAENANQANNLAETVRQAAEKGSGQMTQMLGAMESINASSQQIAKIIKVIDDIAFQTNLLALNAAVEAARAGRHGKGFAVVADEVRNLAGRSAKAAKETTELIESSGSKTAAGMQVANATAESFKDIVSGIEKTHHLVGEIAAASNEQAQGVSQVNIGLGQVDQVTQQNTANAEETASAAEELSSQATHLQGLVGRFKLRSQTTAPTSSSPRPNKGRALKSGTVPSAGGHTVTSTDRGGWEEASGSANQTDIIRLDDSEFGKY